nr:putative rhamnosyl transferase [uncultured Ruegeria sp.]
MQVIGLCRFSYPALGGFQIEHKTPEDRRRYLYSPRRLEERFRLFESSTLPCFREQTDEDFQLLIVIGDCLPTQARDRLHDLTANIRQVRIIERKPARHRRVMQDILNAARQDPDQPCLQFRHDDDDAVSVDFVERLRLAAQDCRGLFENNPAVGIDFNNGFLARMDATGIRALNVYSDLVTAGLGMHVQGGCPLTIMNFAHNKIARRTPVVSYPDAPMWVRSLNQFNDSPQTRNSKAGLSDLSPEQEGEFIARFAIDQNVVRRVHSAG